MCVSVCLCVCVCMHTKLLHLDQTLPCCGLWPSRLLDPWDSLGENSRLGSHALLQWVLPTQELNPCLLYWRQILFCWAYGEDPNSYIPRPFENCIFFLLQVLVFYFRVATGNDTYLWAHTLYRLEVLVHKTGFSAQDLMKLKQGWCPCLMFRVPFPAHHYW